MNDNRIILKRLNDLSNRNIQLWTEDGKLKFKAAAGMLTAGDKEFLKSNKEAVISCLLRDEIVIEKDTENQYRPFGMTEIQQAYVLGRNLAFPYSGTACHIYLEFEYDGLDNERVQKIWNKLIARHPMLRATMSVEGYQQVLENVPKFEVNLFEYADNAKAQEGRSGIKAEYDHKIYDTASWPLFTVIQSRSPESDMLHISIEFVIADWTSIWTVLSEFETLYYNENAVLAELDLSFRDYLTAEKKMRQGSRYYKAREYWLDRIDSLPRAPELPVLSDEGEKPVRFERNCFKIAKDKWDAFCGISRAFGITPAAAVMSVYAFVLSKWSRNKVFCLSLSILNRLPLHPQVGEIVGDFTASDLLETSRKRAQKFWEYALDINRRLFQDLDNRQFTGINVLRELQQRNGGSVLMPYVFTGAIGLIDHEKSSLHGRMTDNGISQTAQVFLDCQAMDTAEGLNINLDSRAGIFPEGLIKDIADVMKDTFGVLASVRSAWETDDPYPQFPAWQNSIITTANNTRAEQREYLLHETVIRSIRLMPEKLFVADSAAKWSGREIFDIVCRTAGALRNAGVGKGDFVAVASPKSRWQTAACLGILSVGAAYVPIDTEQGVERCIKILDKVGIRWVICNSDQKDNEIFVKYMPVVIDELQENGFDFDRDSVMVSTHDTAYIIFTSGSTGEPKGVEISHKAAVNTIEAVNRIFGITDSDCAFQISQLNFDLSVYDIFGVLGAGGSIVIPDKDQYRNPAHWAELMQSYHITVWNSVPALMQLLLIYLSYNKDASFPPMKAVLLSGDWIPVDMPGKIKSIFKGTRVSSLGGATEGGIWSVYHDCDDKSEGFSLSIPYGKPLPNQGFRIMDSLGKDCPIWAAGELLITGESLATSYYGDKGLTEKAFITLDGERVYRTGDVGCYHPDGNIEFLGRADGQVKIRGHRIELGEIEAAMKEKLGLTEVCCVVIDTGGEKKLAALAVCEKSYSDKELTSALSRRLPAYMIPAVCISTDSIPLTRNGKVDTGKAAMLAAANIAEKAAASHSSEPMDELEMLIRDIMAEALGVENIRLDDDFYEIGANSLMLARAAGQLNTRIETGAFDSYLIQLLNGPTVRQVAEFVRNFGREEAGESTEQSETQTIALRTVGSNQFIIVFSAGLEGVVMDALDKVRDRDVMIVPDKVTVAEVTKAASVLSDSAKISLMASDIRLKDCLTAASDVMVQGIIPDSVTIIETEAESEADTDVTYMGDMQFALVYTPMDQSNELKEILGELCAGDIIVTDCSDSNKLQEFIDGIFNL